MIFEVRVGSATETSPTDTKRKRRVYTPGCCLAAELSAWLRFRVHPFKAQQQCGVLSVVKYSRCADSDAHNVMVILYHEANHVPCGGRLALFFSNR